MNAVSFASPSSLQLLFAEKLFQGFEGWRGGAGGAIEVIEEGSEGYIVHVRERMCVHVRVNVCILSCCKVYVR